MHQEQAISMKPYKSFIRVYYEDTDFTGAVYHANYLKYFERARSDFLRELGTGHQKLLTYDPPRAFTIKSLTLDYFAIIKIESLIEICTLVTKLSTASITFHQEIIHKNQIMAQLDVCVVGINHEGKPYRFPKDLYHAIKSKLTNQNER